MHNYNQCSISSPVYIEVSESVSLFCSDKHTQPNNVSQEKIKIFY